MKSSKRDDLWIQTADTSRLVTLVSLEEDSYTYWMCSLHVPLQEESICVRIPHSFDRTFMTSHFTYTSYTLILSYTYYHCTAYSLVPTRSTTYYYFFSDSFSLWFAFIMLARRSVDAYDIRITLPLACDCLLPVSRAAPYIYSSVGAIECH